MFRVLQFTYETRVFLTLSKQKIGKISKLLDK